MKEQNANNNFFFKVLGKHDNFKEPLYNSYDRQNRNFKYFLKFNKMSRAYDIFRLPYPDQ